MKGSEETGTFPHLDASGRAHMVDVGGKPATRRQAVAAGRVRMAAKTLRLLLSGQMAKGDALAVARVAGIMAAKETSRLIPLCHPIALTAVSVEFTPVHGETCGCLDIEARCETVERTGVEMEALTAVSVAALSLYDMCKAADRDMVIEYVRLETKSGGRSGTYSRQGSDPGKSPS